MSLNLSSLTSKQKKVYYAIEAFINERGLPPTVREIGELVGEKTPGAIQGILNRLEQKGVIKRETGMARSIKLISESSPYSKPSYLPEIKKISARNVHDLTNIYNIVKYQPFPEGFFNAEEECFLFACPDNSLMNSDIKYGDMLIVSTKVSISDGDIVLVLFENHVLLRRFFSTSSEDRIVLKADSNLLGREEFERSELTIIGKLAGRYVRY